LFPEVLILCWFLKQVQSKNYTIVIGGICLKIQRQKKWQLLGLTPNQLDGLIKITNSFPDVLTLSFGRLINAHEP